MKQNVGVARAWNIGLDMAEADSVFIVNADAHISAESVEVMQRGLTELPDAACVGPQGAFIDFPLCTDHLYFDRGSFDRPIEIDSVSGFFFAVNRRLFARHGIRFENDYTPCYFEEWDLGLQLRRVGLKSYIVPTTAYDHHWSGTIRALRTIPYLGREETAGEILLRNRRLFLAKWRNIAGKEGRPELLDSGWKKYILERARELLGAGRQQDAAEHLGTLLQRFPDDFTAASMLRFISLS
jgi:GT2 family glycosyltransferase